MVTASNHRGFFEWIVQRVSAVLIGAYTLFLFIFFFTHHPLHYPAWENLFSYAVMRIATVLVVFAMVWHAWIGLWTVFTDYVKCGYIRLFLEITVVILLLGYVVWCLDALYG